MTGRGTAHEDAGTALRGLAHALVGHDAPPALLAEIAATANAWSSRLRAGAVHQRSVGDYLDDIDEGLPDDGGAVRHFEDCPVCGTANPMSVRVPAWRDGEGAIARVALGAAHEGAPGRAHGGVVAALFDDTMGFVTSMMGLTAYQFDLSIHYAKPTPIGPELEIRAWPVERVGRRFVVDANIIADGIETATARGSHIVVDRARVIAANPRRGSPGV